MTEYEAKVQELHDRGIEVIELFPSPDLPEGIKGLCIDGKYIWIRPTMTTAQKLSVLYEEEAHCELTEGNILSNTINSIKQEKKARKKAYTHVPADRIIEAVNAGCRNRFEIAEFLGISEEFLQEIFDELTSFNGGIAI